MDAAEATDPIERIDPAEPMLKIEPVEPIDRIDPVDPMLRIEPADPAGCCELRAIPICGFSHYPAGSAPVGIASGTLMTLVKYRRPPGLVSELPCLIRFRM
jgi:hypothetical protein